MIKFATYLWPRRLGAQIVLLIIVSVGFSLGLYAFTAHKAAPPPPGTNRGSAPVIDHTMNTLSRLRPNDPRAADIAAAALVIAPETEIHLVQENELPPRDRWGPVNPGVAGRLKFMGAVGYIVPARGMDMQQIVEFENGLLVSSMVSPPPPGPLNPPGLQPMTSKGLLVLAITVPLALFWVARNISSRLRSFAQAAEEFSIGADHHPLPETGPEEIQVAARALNRMRERITEVTNDRTRMISSVGHDLRTPVTRMRLRTEFIKDPELREGMMQDLRRMETMIDSALTYLKEGRAEQRRVKIDLHSLVKTICDQFTDVGAGIECVIEDNAYVYAEEDSLVRATENLIQNGLRHAKKVRLSLTRSGEKEVAIQIDDDGPGIPSDQRASLLKPFSNGVGSVSSNEQNYGLGLSIVDAIAHAHGGRLDLGDSEMGGLCARIILPVGNGTPAA